jgi:hypothetical protein
MILNKSCLDVDFPDGLMVSDPPYNQGYHYSTYKDKLKRNEFLKLLSVFRRPCVVIGYPEMIINELTDVLGKVDEVVSWVYPSNTAKQSRLVAWYGCKPDFRKIGQPYKNPTDKRIAKRIAEGKTARAYDWWEINQVKNVSKQKTIHPCPIPEELARRIIVSTAKEGQTIIDPFTGTGTTLRVASRFGHPIFGTEIDKTYYDVASLIDKERTGDEGSHTQM